MRKTLFTLVAALTVIGGLMVSSVGAQDASTSDGVSLTIYNQGTALVQDRRTFDLQSGENTLDFTDVAASIDATSVSFKSLTDPLGTSVLEQNYVYDLVGSGALLERYLDQKVEIVANDGTTFSGQLLSGRNGEVILRADDGQVTVVSQTNIRDIRFPALPEGLITRPTLRWLLQAGTTGKQQVELTYLTGGMTWTADYTVLLATDNTKLDLNGWVTLSNTSGASFKDAQVKLVAGDVNRLPSPDQLQRDQGMMVQDAVAAAPPQVAQRDFFEYQLYEINRRVTVADNETKQVEFVSGADVPAHTFFVYDGGAAFYGYGYPITDQYYGQSGVTDVQNWLEFSTGDDKGLGADLPAGRIRVYQEDTDGAALLIGENQIDHTPKGEDVKLYLGNAFDLVGEHTQTNFQIIGSNVVEETYEIKLRNRKDSDTVQIRVPEHLFRWSNWEILNASMDYTKLNSNTIEFRADVAPGEEKVITYTVRYTWPQ
ncbi:MAG: DUF4139 domain-containing protein [Chloroflexota bacterium]